MRSLNRVRFKADEVLAYEGKKGDAMFVIAEGIVKVMSETRKGVAVTLARLGEGEVIGEMALIDNGNRSRPRWSPKPTDGSINWRAKTSTS